MQRSQSTTPTWQEQREQMRSGRGFIAALDQSGGSTPAALARYGIPGDDITDEAQMFTLIHEMRSRIIESPAFGGERVIGAILFVGSLDRLIASRSVVDELWNVKRVVPFVKIDVGLSPESDGVRLMKPIPALEDMLSEAVAKGIFGTKMRSLISLANPDGVASAVAQQFDVARIDLAAGLVPIIEPEVDIFSAEKPEAEAFLKGRLIHQLDELGEGQDVILKLSLPSIDDFYEDLIEHPRVLRVAALSGGYGRREACDLLARNHGMIASFSRALTEGLSVSQSDGEFDATLDASIQSIYEASTT